MAKIIRALCKENAPEDPKINISVLFTYNRPSVAA